MLQSKKSCAPREATHSSVGSIQKQVFRSQIVLIITLALILGLAGSLINLHFETEKRDQNLRNVAETIAQSPLLINIQEEEISTYEALGEYLDSLKTTLGDIDVISIVNKNKVRVYHSNPSLIGVPYEGTLPTFTYGEDSDYHTTDEEGPSGKQRRAYAPIYDKNGEYIGCVMAIMLMENIQEETWHTFLIFALITLVAIVIELIISSQISHRIKRSLLGYEPDMFTAMYKMRDNILETLKEGILATDNNGTIQFANSAALRMLRVDEDTELYGQSVDFFEDPILSETMKEGEREFNVNIARENIILDRVPIKDNEKTVGAIGILHNREEYTRLMQDLSGTRYLVDSMRANNHDFTNKLHVILGLIQMEMYDEASSYIQNITMVQRENISKVMNSVQDPSVAALLIGKIARAAELNVSFELCEGSFYSPSDLHLSSETLITVIGNLLDNAFDAMDNEEITAEKHLSFGIYSRPGAVLITVVDNGKGILGADKERIFENGFSTKGEGRGTGLYQVKNMVERLGGKIIVESEEGKGTSFAVSFGKGIENV